MNPSEQNGPNERAPSEPSMVVFSPPSCQFSSLSYHLSISCLLSSHCIFHFVKCLPSALTDPISISFLSPTKREKPFLPSFLPSFLPHLLLFFLPYSVSEKKWNVVFYREELHLSLKIFEPFFHTKKQMQIYNTKKFNSINESFSKFLNVSINFSEQPTLETGTTKKNERKLQTHSLYSTEKTTRTTTEISVS
jgi:hypothetical protein